MDFSIDINGMPQALREGSGGASEKWLKCDLNDVFSDFTDFVRSTYLPMDIDIDTNKWGHSNLTS